MNEERIARVVVAVLKAIGPDDDDRTPALPGPPELAPEPGPERVGVSATIAISKADTDLRHGVIYGVVSSLRVDKATDYVADDYELEAMAIRFMEYQAVQKAHATDTHDFGDVPGTFVASWVSDGKWRVGFKPQDIQIARDAAAGEIVGFSIGGACEMET